MTRVRMPGLLNGELLETARLRVLGGQYQLTADEPSQATLTIPEDGPVVKLRDWIALHDAAGLMGIYRVTNITQTVRRHIQLTLLHGIDVLADSYWAAETEYKGKPRGFLEAALNEQTALIDDVKPWQLGACEDTETDLDEKISYSRLSDVVPKAVQEGGDYQFEYDQSHFPWTMNLVRKPTAAACEFRLLRNITSATITYNDADLCTRLILSNTSGGESRVRVYDAGAAIQAEWGVVTKTASIDTNDDLDAASWPETEAWVAAFFALHAAPSVQIQIEGRELFSLTGESWDRASLGRMCRVALPDYGHTFLERVVAITYPDPFGDPDRVVVSLANTLPKFSETVKLLEKTAQSASRAAGGAARKADQTEAALDEHKVLYQAAINKTDREISGIASATGLQFNADGTPVVDPETGEFIYSETHPDNALIAQIQLQAGRYDRIIQATGISETPEQGEVSLVTQVSQTHQQLSQAAIATGLVWDASLNNGSGGFKVDPDAISSSVYKQLAGQISAKVSASDVKTQVEAYGYTTLTAARNAASAMIGADLKDANGVITSAKIKALVEGDTSLIQLVADKIDLSGYVTMTDFNATKGVVDDLTGNTIKANTFVRASSMHYSNSYGGNAYAAHFYVTTQDQSGTSIGDCKTAYNGASGSFTNGVFNLQLTRVDGSTATIIPFDVTATDWYTGQIAAARSSSASDALSAVNLSGWQLSNGQDSAAVNLVRDGNNVTLKTVELPPAANFEIVPGTFSKTTGEATVTVRTVFGTTKGGIVKTGTVTAPLEDKTGTEKITANGTYTPSGANIGFSSVEVDVPASTYGSFEGFTTASAIPESGAVSSKPTAYSGGQMSSNTVTIRSVLSNNGGSTYYTGDAVTVNASNLVNTAANNAKQTALNGVKLSGWQLNSSSHNAENIVRDADNNDLKTVSLPSNWDISVGAFNSSGSATITVRPVIGGSNGTQVATGTIADSNLKPENIKSGVSIFGKTGTYEGEGGSFDLSKLTVGIQVTTRACDQIYFNINVTYNGQSYGTLRSTSVNTNATKLTNRELHSVDPTYGTSIRLTKNKLYYYE